MSEIPINIPSVADNLNEVVYKISKKHNGSIMQHAPFLEQEVPDTFFHYDKMQSPTPPAAIRRALMRIIVNQAINETTLSMRREDEQQFGVVDAVDWQRTIDPLSGITLVKPAGSPLWRLIDEGSVRNERGAQGFISALSVKLWQKTVELDSVQDYN